MQNQEICKTHYKIQDEILNCDIDEETGEYTNDKAKHDEIQNRLGKHLLSCTHESCQKSKTARINAGIMDKDGNYTE